MRLLGERETLKELCVVNLDVCNMKCLLIFNKYGSEEGAFDLTCRVAASLRGPRIHWSRS